MTKVILAILLLGYIAVSTAQNVTDCDNTLTVCQSQPDNTTLAYEGYCGQWITCQAGCALVSECPNNLQWVQKSNGIYGNYSYCDFPENLSPPCPWPASPPSTGASGIACTDQVVCAGKPDGTQIVNPAGLNGFIICQCECPLVTTCDEGLVYNEELEVCDWPSSG